jgi:hypothetical protein
MKIKLIPLMIPLLTLHTMAARHVVVVVPPSLPTAVREDAARLSARMLYESEPGTRVTVFDSSRMATVSDVVVPAGTQKFRFNVAAPQLTNVTALIRGASDNSRTFDTPAILDYVGRQLRAEGQEMSVVLMGPAIYRNPKEPRYDMSAGWPSDANLTVPRGRSIFSTLDKSNVLSNVSVSWYVTDVNAATNAAHAEGLSRFWSLFIATQGGVLSGFSPDLLNAFALAREARQMPFRTAQLDRLESVPRMISAVIPDPSLAREPDLAVPGLALDRLRVLVTNIVTQTNIVTVTNEVVAIRDTILPPTRPKNTRIGLIWLKQKGSSQQIDLDLHVEVPADRDELSFQHQRTPRGRYFRDVREASNERKGGDWATSWEAVELDGDQLPREVWIHIYSGQGPCQGEVRVLYRGVEQRAAFTFPAVVGDGNASNSRRERSDRWVRMDLGFVVSPQ